MRSRTFFFILLTFFISCTTTIRTDNTVQKYQATESKKIIVFVNDKVDREYEILGEVSAHTAAGASRFKIRPASDRDADATVNQLKKAAAKLGADAIINLRLGYTTGEFISITSNGTAIKFKN